MNTNESYLALVDSLLQQRAEVDNKIATIELQLDLSKDKYHNGEAVDGQWLAKAKYALRKTKAERQAVQDRIGVANKRFKQFSAKFRDIAKSQLDEETFLRIDDLTREALGQ